MMKSWMKVLIALVVVLGIFFGAGFRIAHPVSGLSSSLGNAKSSLAVYKADGQTTVGSKIVLDIKGVGTAIGIVRATAGGNTDVDLGASLVRVPSNDVSGKLFAVIPFLGSIAGIIGL
jgi:hypothetical protein